MRETGERGAVEPLLAPAAAPLSFTAVSPPEQGDVISGLTLAIAGVGPATVPSVRLTKLPGTVREGDAWAVAVDSETGWYALCSQDCDIVAEADDEPTVSVAPLVLVDEQRWHDLNQNTYSARWYAYPGDKFNLPDGKALAVDLAWTTSVLKGSLQAPSVQGVRPFTGPQKLAFGEWLAARNGRVPFPDDVVKAVLDPCYEVRKRLLSTHRKAAAKNQSAPVDARAVGAVVRWYAHSDGRNATILGQLTGPSLRATGFIDDDGQTDTTNLEQGRTKLTAKVLSRMDKDAPGSGFSVQLRLADLATVRASQFQKFALLLR